MNKKIIYEIVYENLFKKDYKRQLDKYKNQKNIIQKNNIIIKQLQNNSFVKGSYDDHFLVGKQWKGCKNLHIKSDLLLIYKIENNQ
jgi:mRNA interferase YafQ